jgi:hypothetical protein
MKVAKDLHDGTFKFNPGRLKDISKGNGQIRTLSITSPSSPVWLGPLVQATRGIKISPALVLWTKAGRTRDKIVQKAIGIILEAAYEPLFSIHSFGFRPKKSTHDALSELRLRGAGFT